MKECDLVMKGGVSSGIVYPKAVSVLAEKYRFRSIGGTSAGAIAAAFTAAAEYNRQKNDHDQGFELLESQLPNEIAENLLHLFQPDKKHQLLFESAIEYSNIKDSGKWELVKFILKKLKLFKVLKRLPESLPETNYGLCSGLTVSSGGVLGLIDWLNYWLEDCAGRLTNKELPSKPLTFGDLKSAGVNLKVITTNISTQQSIALPFKDKNYAKVDELRYVLSENVVDYLVQYHQDKNNQEFNEETDILELPEASEFPVIMAVRMSLSFPILLSAVSLYSYDRTLRNFKHNEENKPQKCWYSDGGITSNFPIHLFDDVFPLRPTFGITLDEFHDKRHDKDVPVNVGKNRIYLPTLAGQGLHTPINKIKGLLSFLSSVFYSAQNWQDKSQIVQPGYRDRIVRIALKDNEGGVNLNMPKDKIDYLVHLGGLAGDEIIDHFDFDEHRWRRLLSSYSAFEKEFNDMYKEFASNKSSESMSKYLRRYEKALSEDSPIASSYKPKDKDHLMLLIKRLTDLAKIAREWEKQQLRNDWGGHKKTMPQPSTSLRLVPGDIYSSGE